ncbi:MAG: ABC transporter permease [Chloroflexi bacterium]|nr:ABC transporter permease [Chloroflexota bacterium]
MAESAATRSGTRIGETDRRERWLATQWRTWRRKPIGLASFLFIVLLVLLAIFAPLLQTHDPVQNSLTSVLTAPSAAHWFGTDPNGRDVYSRLIAGARISVTIGFLAVFISVPLGVAVGLMSGYFGGAMDFAIQRVTDAIMSIPGLILLLAIVSVLDPTIFSITFAMSIFIVPTTIRVVRGEVLVSKEREYVQAARAIGAQPVRLMTRHILPNVMAPILIIASVTVGQAILIESALGFLGFGVPPPDPTWGNMLSGANRRYMAEAPWIIAAPGLAITLTVLAFNMFGDALRDVLDPRLRGS